MPKVSIIIPIYNSEEYLERCILSVINQTLKEIEIILVNDGSIDNSLNIMNSFAIRDNRIAIINQSNKGLSSARNVGLLTAKSDYISFLDSDDYIEKEMLEILYLDGISNKSDIVLSKYKRINNKGEFFSISKIENIEKDLIGNILNFGITPIVCNKLYKKDLFTLNNIYFPLKMYYEDHIVNLKLFFYAKKVSFVNIPFYNWFERSGSITNNFSKKHIEDVFITLDSIKAFLVKNRIYDKYKKLFYLRIIIVIETDIFKKLLDFYNNEWAEFTINQLIEFKDFDLIQLKNWNEGCYYNFIYYMYLLENKYYLSNIKYFTENKAYLFFSNVFNKNNENSLGLLKILLENIKRIKLQEAYIYSIGSDFEKIFNVLTEGITILDLIDNHKDTKIINYQSFKVRCYEDIEYEKDKVANFIVANINSSTEITNKIELFCKSKNISYNIVNFYSIRSCKKTIYTID